MVEKGFPPHDLDFLDAVEGLQQPFLALGVPVTEAAAAGGQTAAVKAGEDQHKHRHDGHQGQHGLGGLDHQIDHQCQGGEALAQDVQQRQDQREAEVHVGGQAALQVGHIVVDQFQVALLHVDAHEAVGNARLVFVGEAELQVVHEQQVDVLEHVDRDQRHAGLDDEVPHIRCLQQPRQKGIQAVGGQHPGVHDDIDQRQNGRHAQQFQKTADDKGDQQQEKVQFLPAVENKVELFQHWGNLLRGRVAAGPAERRQRFALLYHKPARFGKPRIFRRCTTGAPVRYNGSRIFKRKDRRG